MYRKRITSVTVSTELFHIEPLQDYLSALALHCGVPRQKMMQLKVLIEEVFSHIVVKCFLGRDDAQVTVSVDVTMSDFILTFAYQGLPFAYDMETTETEADEISLQLIRSLSSTYRMKEDGKRGQTIEISLALTPVAIDENPAARPESAPDPDEKVQLRQVRADEMEKLVQCLYKVFGYTYSAEAVYYPELLRERLATGLYKGFVAVNGRGDIVAHTALLKSSAQAAICECGQAFVSPEYEHRGLFMKLKTMLMEEACRCGLQGVFSSSVTGHPYTQAANIRLGCIETGLELSYIPNNLKSIIHREGEEQRQTVMSYFKPTGQQRPMEIYAPDRHRGMIGQTYAHLGLERTFLSAPAIPLSEDASDIEEMTKTEWNQLHISIINAGYDLAARIRRIIRRAMANGTAVAYIPLDLTDPRTPSVVDTLESEGFIYSGIMPYECDGHDAIRLQFVADTDLNPDYIITCSPWGAEIKNYVMKQLQSVE
ncbi:MAG: hypothetical protein ACI3ZL_03965 [Candidatus Cryptobacteroides sp.]